MRKYILTIATIIFLGFIFYLFPQNTKASEGIFELASQTSEPSKCYALSLRMQNFEYKILFSCRYLIYPVDETIFNYIMWATPRDGGKTVKLGALGLGKGEFKTKTPFTTLFVTTESNKDTKTPAGTVVMKGNVQPIEFLESGTTQIPTGSESEEEPEQPKVEDEQPLTTREKLALAIKRAGIAALFALVVLIGIIFVVSRSRG